MEINIIDLDLAKNIFQTHGTDASGGALFCASSFGGTKFWSFVQEEANLPNMGGLSLKAPHMLPDWSL